MITRWEMCQAEPEEDDDGPLYTGMLSSDTGEWVRWEDHVSEHDVRRYEKAALLAALALRGANVVDVVVTNEPVDPSAKRCIHCSIIEPRHATYCKLYRGPQADAGGNLGATAMSKNIPLVTVNHLLMLLQDARSGQSEMLMKEVWEDCSKEEIQLADNELALMMRYLEDRKHALRPRTEEPKIYPWKDPDGVVMGHITVSVDKNLLPILAIDVEDDHFSGIVEHKDLFRIITQIAELTSKKGS